MNVCILSLCQLSDSVEILKANVSMKVVRQEASLVYILDLPIVFLKLCWDCLWYEICLPLKNKPIKTFWAIPNQHHKMYIIWWNCQPVLMKTERKTVFECFSLLVLCSIDKVPRVIATLRVAWPYKEGGTECIRED